MKITLCGKIGAGKSVIANFLAKEYDLKHYSTGDLMRQIAKQKGLTIGEFDKQTPKEIDNMVDDRTKKIGQEEDNFIFDSKLAFHFIPDAIKIFLEVTEEEAANRIFKNQRDSESKTKTKEELVQKIKERWNDSRQRFIKLYHVDIQDKNNYDIVINTTNKPIEDVIAEVKRAIQALRKT